MKEIVKPFSGQPHSSLLLIQLLVTKADTTSGIVSDISYNEIAKALTVNPAPGRKCSGTPSKQTIRNYIKSIERECGDSFKVISSGNKLQFIFPYIPQKFKNSSYNTEVNIECDNRVHQVFTGKTVQLEGQSNIDINTEVNSQNQAVKNIKIINKTNKQTQTPINEFSCSKKPIGDDFYPNTKTIEMAFAMGLTKVTDKKEIQAFIKHNKKQNTQWADYNPVFLTWLERDAQYMQRQQQKQQGQLRRSYNECGAYQRTSSSNKTALEQVSEHHGICIESIWDLPNDNYDSGEFIEGTPIQFVDKTHCDLRSNVY